MNVILLRLHLTHLELTTMALASLSGIIFLLLWNTVSRSMQKVFDVNAQSRMNRRMPRVTMFESTSCAALARSS
jgi:hypothetical protein